jgi:hypothetical protein
MPETRLKCPSCEAVLKLTAPLSPGKAIKCPKCGAAVRAPAATGKPGGSVAASRPAPRPQAVRKPKPEEEPDEEAEDLDDEEEAPRPKKGARRAADDEDEDFDDRPRKRGKKSKKKQGNPLLLWGSIGGGVAAVLLVVVVLFATGVLGGKKGDQGGSEKKGSGKGGVDGDENPAQRPPVGTPPKPATGVRAEKDVQVLAYSPDGKYLATSLRVAPKVRGGHFGGAVKVWDLGTAQELAKFEGHAEEIRQLAFSPDGQLLASSSDGELRLWDLRTRSLLHRLADTKGEPPLGARLLAFAPNGKHVVSMSQGLVVSWDVATGKSQPQIVPMNRTAYAASSPAAPVVAVAQVQSVRPLKIELIAYDYSKQDGPAIPLSLAPTAVAYSGDGSTLAIATSDGPIQVYDTKTWQPKATLEKQRGGSFLYYEKARLNKDGTVLYALPSVSGRPNIEAWTVGTAQTRPLPNTNCWDFALSPDGQTLAVAFKGEGVKFIDPASGQEKAP